MPEVVTEFNLSGRTLNVSQRNLSSLFENIVADTRLVMTCVGIDVQQRTDRTPGRIIGNEGMFQSAATLITTRGNSDIVADQNVVGNDVM